MLLRSTDLSERILLTRRASLVGYWPLSEPSGTTVFDASGNGFHGVYTGVALAQPGVGDGRTSPFFDGTNDYANLFGAGLAAAFNSVAGTIAIWAMPSTAALWTDSASHRLMTFQATATNRAILTKSSSNNLQWTYTAASTSKLVSLAGASVPAGWVHLAMTWDKAAEEMKAYLNGAQQGATQTALGIWAGALTSAILGAPDLTPTTPFAGWEAHAAVWSAALTPGEIARLGRRS